MISSLQIKNYKALKDIKLDNLSRINYFVGKNGHGKTSIVEMLTYLRNFEIEGITKDSAQLRFAPGNHDILRAMLSHFTKTFSATVSEGQVISNSVSTITNSSFRLGGISNDRDSMRISIEFNPTDIEFFQDFMNKRYRTIIIDNGNFLPKFANKSTKVVSYGDIISLASSLHTDNINRISNELGNEQNIRRIEEPGITLFLDNNDKRYDIESLSLGLKTLLGLEEYLQREIQNESLLLIIEEPEISLHPSAQKLIPKIISKTVNEFVSRGFDLQVLITTHSPFIISATTHLSNQKVYLIDNGSTIDLSNKPGEGSHGYSGKEVLPVVARMLGASEVDFGYPDNYCIVEESSLEKLLDTLRDKGVLRNWEFISASGNSKAIKLAKRLEMLKQPRTLLVCNLWYADKYNIILDGVSASDSTKASINSLQNSMGNRLTILKRQSLEEYYPEEIKKKFEEEFKPVKSNHEQEGIVKNKFALLMADMIMEAENPAKAFSNTFSSELDFLIK